MICRRRSTAGPSSERRCGRRKVSQKGLAQKTLHHFPQMKMPSRESRCRQTLNLPWPTFVRGWSSGSAWPGSLRFGRRGYSERRMLLVTGLRLYCTVPRQLRKYAQLTRAMHPNTLFVRPVFNRSRPDGSSVLACRVVPRRLSYSDVGTRSIVADSIRNLGQEERAVVMPHWNTRQTTSRNGCWANHCGYR